MHCPFVIRFHHPENCVSGIPFGFGFEIENTSALRFRQLELKLEHQQNILGIWSYDEAQPGQQILERYLELRIDEATTAGFSFTLKAVLGDRLHLEWSGRVLSPAVWKDIASAPVTIRGDTYISAHSLEGGVNIRVGGNDYREIFEQQRTQTTSYPPLELREQALKAQPFSVNLPGDVALNFVSIPSGSGKLGTTSESDAEAGAANLEAQKVLEAAKSDPGIKRGLTPLEEGPIEDAFFRRPFWVAATPVTIAQYCAVTQTSMEDITELYESRKSGWVDPRRLHPSAPIVYLDWEEASDFCRKLTRREYLEMRIPNGFSYRLPTENEWEYACRANSGNPRYGAFEEIAWQGSPGALRVGGGRPNAFGLHDMLGFVWQWCEASRNDTEPGTRILRGGSASLDNPKRMLYARASARVSLAENGARGSIGFRPVLAWDED